MSVSNPGGKTSSGMVLTVTAPIVAPAITTLSPSPMSGSNAAQTLTINGSGFLAGLKLSIGGSLITAAQLAVLTPTQIQVSIVTGITARTYAVQVVNANGGVSNVVNLQVNAAPVPTITSLTPNPMTHSTGVQTLTVNGTNFQSGLKVTVGSASYSGSQITAVSATQIKVLVTLASASSMAVTVANPSGAVSNLASLAVK